MLVALTVLASVALPQDGSRTLRYFEMEPTPFGEILYSRPNLEWRVWGDAARVSKVRMSIDDNHVEARYSNDRVSGLIGTPLTIGTHSVDVEVTFASGHKIEKSWEFRVGRGAIDRLPGVTAAQTDLIARVNAIRRAHGLDDVVQNGALMAAASAHVNYMSTHASTGHREDSTSRGYTGRSPGDRARAFGYYERNSEAVAVSSRGSERAIEDLFFAPYHRLMFLQPGRLDFGAATKGRATCVKFGGGGREGIVLSPADGETDVPRSWDGIETPNPMGSSSEGPYGYPVVLAVFGDDAKGFKVVRALLRYEDGYDVPARILHPSNDKNAKDCLVIVPLKPLNAKSRYEVEVSLASNGRQFKREWSFTTGQ